MHISAVNIFKMVADRKNNTIEIKYEVMCFLSIVIFAVDLDSF